MSFTALAEVNAIVSIGAPLSPNLACEQVFLATASALALLRVANFLGKHPVRLVVVRDLRYEAERLDVDAIGIAMRRVRAGAFSTICYSISCSRWPCLVVMKSNTYGSLSACWASSLSGAGKVREKLVTLPASFWRS